MSAVTDPALMAYHVVVRVSNPCPCIGAYAYGDVETRYPACIFKGYRSISPTMFRTSLNAALSFSSLSLCLLLLLLLAIEYPPILPCLAFSLLLSASLYQHTPRMLGRNPEFSRERMSFLSNNVDLQATPISSASGSEWDTIHKLLPFGSRASSSFGKPKCSEL